MYIVINNIPIKDSSIKEISKIQKLDSKLYKNLVYDLFKYPGFDIDEWQKGQNYNCYQNDVLRYLDNLIKANPDYALTYGNYTGILKVRGIDTMLPNLYNEPNTTFIDPIQINWGNMPELYFYTLQTESTTLLSQIYFSKEEAEDSQDKLLNILNDGVLFKILL